MQFKNNLILEYDTKYANDITGYLMSLKGMRVKGSNYYYEINVPTEDNVSFTWNGEMFIIKSECGLDLQVGKKYTPFNMLTATKFNGDSVKAMWYVCFDLFGEKVPYVRVGYKFFKNVPKVDAFGITRMVTALWDKTTILDDYGRPMLSKIAKLDDFTMEPNNKKFQRIVGNNYNLYKPFEHTEVPQSKLDLNSFPWSKKLLSHIFGSSDTEFELGCRYMKVLYDHPRQMLPILVMTSIERQTGKTTFINWLSILFGGNVVIVNPSNINSDFNSSYADKNIIAIEETRIEKTSTLEKLKSLATAKLITVNAKHMNEYTLPFFGKLIITSNNEDKFSRVDEEEIRYWVRRIPSLKGDENHNVLEDVRDEAPQFLAFLSSLPDVDLSKHRMVFTPEEIHTEALDDTKKDSRSELYKEIESELDHHCMQNQSVREIVFAPKDLKTRWFERNNNWMPTYINKVLKNEMKLDKSQVTQLYTPLEQNNEIGNGKVRGKPYTYINPYYEEENDYDDDDDFVF